MRAPSGARSAELARAARTVRRQPSSVSRGAPAATRPVQRITLCRRRRKRRTSTSPPPATRRARSRSRTSSRASSSRSVDRRRRARSRARRGGGRARRGRPQRVALREAAAELRSRRIRAARSRRGRRGRRPGARSGEVGVVPEDRHGADRRVGERPADREPATEPLGLLDDRGRRRGDGHRCCSSARPASQRACSSGWLGGLGASHQPVLSGPATARSRSTARGRATGRRRRARARTAGSTSSGAWRPRRGCRTRAPIAAKSGE